MVPEVFDGGGCMTPTLTVTADVPTLQECDDRHSSASHHIRTETIPYRYYTQNIIDLASESKETYIRCYLGLSNAP
jgi:hypothetical protein